jgi:large subunit ribosomal protein L37Ae
MTHGTKKVGIAGKYGARYGVKIRKRLAEVETGRVQKRQCPRCKHVSVKRTDTGIWVCRRCDYKYAAGAYAPKIREFKREDLLVKEEDKKAADAKPKGKKAPKRQPEETEELAPESGEDEK